MQSNLTARFGGLGDGDYSWGINESPFWEAFKEPTVGMTVGKYAVEKTTAGDGTVTENLRTSSTQSYVGYPSTFETSNLATSGNMPLFGETAAFFEYDDYNLNADGNPTTPKLDADGNPIRVLVKNQNQVPSWADADVVDPTAGPVLEETLPDYFRLMNMEIIIDPENTPEELWDMEADEKVSLGTYFDTNYDDFEKKLNSVDSKLPRGMVVQFEVEEPKGADEYDIYWVTAGAPELDTTATDGLLHYRLGTTAYDDASMENDASAAC